MEVEAELEDAKFAGIGTYLFASLLERFLGLYVSINSFTRFIAKPRRGEALPWTWPPRAGDQVLLESRPPAGIWGGLLSLPELPAGATAAEYCARHLGVTIDAAQLAMRPAPTFSHSFTHFRLHIQPLLCAATTPHCSLLAEPGLRWVSIDALAQTGLPAPVRRLLNETL